MGRIYKRGVTWWGDWRDAKGQRHQRSLATRDKAVARERLRQNELAAPDRRAHGQTLGAAVAHLLDVVYAGRAAGTISCYRVKARHLVRMLGEHVPLADITKAAALQYRAKRITEGASTVTVAKELVVLRLALAEAGIEDVVPRLPLVYRPRTRHLSEDEMTGLLAALAPKRRLWLVVATMAGPRASELAGLDWSDVDLRQGWLLVRGTKTAAALRRVPISDMLRSWLEVAWQPAGLVLEPWTNQRRDLHDACARAGIAPCTANDLRRTFASWLKGAGVDSLVVAHLLGHSSTRMVDMVYGRLGQSAYQDAVALLPGCNAGVPPAGSFQAGQASVARAAAGESSTTAVPRDGIEPPTRGFSGPGLSVVKGGKR